MRLVPVAAAVFILSMSAPSFAQDWIEYVDRVERFGVSLPGEPTVTSSTYVSEDGKTLPARVYTSQDGPRRYAVTGVNYAGADVTVVRGSIAHAAWNVRKRGGEVTYDAFAQVDRIEGHQLYITNQDRSRTFVAIHLHARRLYIVEATVPSDSPFPGLFQQSLTILDADGNRIRYELDACGNRTTRIR